MKKTSIKYEKDPKGKGSNERYKKKTHNGLKTPQKIGSK